MNCRWIQKSVLRTPIRAVSHARGVLSRSLETGSAERPNSHCIASHSAVGTAQSISIPIRATDLKTQSSWSLNLSCWPVKNASFTEQLQGAHLNSEQYVSALLKLFFLFFFFKFLIEQIAKGFWVFFPSSSYWMFSQKIRLPNLDSFFF